MMKKETKPSAPWFNPEFPRADECVISELISAAAGQVPDKVFAVLEDGSELNYRDLKRHVDQYCACLYRLGVRRGDSVLLWLPNCEQMLVVWFAINSLGAVSVPLNTAARGSYLAHMIANSGARLIIAHHALCQRLADIDTGSIRDLIPLMGTTGELPGIKIHEQHVASANEAAVELPRLAPWDESVIIYTSGTTGLSKGVIASYYHMYIIAAVAYGYMDTEDRILINMPIFHVAAAAAVIATLMRQASIALFDGFDGKRFWSQVRDRHCTVACGLVGTMAQYLEQQPVSEDDLDNPLQMVLMYPVSEQTIGLAKRYGFHYVSGFGTTELPMAMVTDVDCEVTGSCGKIRSGLQWRLVDENDIEVPAGTTGELIVRPEQPWSMMNSYHGMADATAEAWRNGWYHSGDLFRVDDSGYFFYVDRSRDSIRRRGENVSSFEIENYACGFPGILEAAAVGVPAEHGEQDILLIVCVGDSALPDPVALFEYLRRRMPHFMLPRYIKVMEALPKTPTNKVQKHLLRKEGVASGDWDRERVGVVVKRDRLQT